MTPGSAAECAAHLAADSDPERDIDLAELGDSLLALRLCDAAALEAMRRSLVRHG